MPILVIFFDDKYLIRPLYCTGLTDDFISVLADFSDALLAFCKKYPGISLKRSHLYASIVGVTYQAYSSCDDAVALAELVKVSKLQFHDLFHSSKALAINHVKYTDRTSLLNKTAHLTKGKPHIITPSIAKKITTAGQGYCHLDFVYRGDGPDLISCHIERGFQWKAKSIKIQKNPLSLISNFADKQVENIS